MADTSSGKALLDQVMSTHLARLDAATAKAPTTSAEMSVMRDELKSLIVSMMASLSTVLASTVSAASAPLMAQALKEAHAGMSGETEQRVQSIVDEGISRMQALTARVMDVMVEDRKQDAAERKALMQVLAALSKPRTRTGVVDLPSGKVQMTVTETVQ